METILGKLDILIDDISVPYRIVELNNKSELFNVDKRYKVICSIPENKSNSKIECKIKFDNTFKIFSGAENGESLALISFEWGEYKLSLGTLGDLPNIDYQFTDDSIIILGAYPYSQLIVYVAWMQISDIEKEKNYTWFAADPTL